MPPSRIHDLSCVLRGVSLVARAVANGQVRQAELRWRTSSFNPTTGSRRNSEFSGSATSDAPPPKREELLTTANERSSDVLGRAYAVAEGLRQGAPALVRGFVDNIVAPGSPDSISSSSPPSVLAAPITAIKDTSNFAAGVSSGNLDVLDFDKQFLNIDFSEDLMGQEIEGETMASASRPPIGISRKDNVSNTVESGTLPDSSSAEVLDFDKQFLDVDFSETPNLGLGPKSSKPTPGSSDPVADLLNIDASTLATDEYSLPPHTSSNFADHNANHPALSHVAPTIVSTNGAARKTKPKFKAPEPKLNKQSRERSVPASRIARLYNYGTLGVGLGFGALGEVASRTFGMKDPKSGLDTGALLNDNPFLTEANAERIVDTLCRVRGAALKLGQMLSIQDNSMISPQLQKIFERVRYAADFMPTKQVHKVMQMQYGLEWRERFEIFEDRPFAAASIGQVHKAVAKDGRILALKIQYPGVAKSIDSDINNLMTVLNFGNLLPKGLYMDSFARVARREMAAECDYNREADSANQFRIILADSPDFYVPEVFDDLTTTQILASEYIEGVPLDKCLDLDQPTRNWIGESILQLCLNEVFIWHKMQTDPNWSNFFYDPARGKIVLLDFGATQDYSKAFVDKYIRIIRAAADQNREEIIRLSREIGFLTGYEPKVMDDAHATAVMILGEPFSPARLGKPMDFGNQQIAIRVQTLMPTMLQHRLTPPPPETYSLHRKLSGAFLLCAKLRCEVDCAPMFARIWDAYKFGESGEALSV